MLDPRWRKVLRDLWANKTRTALVVLAIAVGVFALGMVTGTRIMLSQDLNVGYMGTDPASAILFLSDPFDEELVETVRRMDRIIDAEGRRNVFVRLKVGEGEWRDMRLDAVNDYDDMRLTRMTPQGAAWPPPEKTMLIERMSLGLARAEIGETVLIETPSGKQRELEVTGLAHDMHKEPANFVGQTYGYITFDTLGWLGFPRSFNELHLLIDSQDKEEIKQIAKEVEDKIEKGGRALFWTWVPDPGKHPADEIVQPMLTVLAALGFLSLILSGFLVVNTISATLTQQIRQIGIMKAIGARTSQIMGLYLSTIMIFSLLSLLVAVPLGALAAYLFTGYMADLINFDLRGFRIPRQALMLELMVGLIAPLLAALWPILSGTRVTVREALNNYGLSKGNFGQGAIDQLLEQIRGLPRPLLLSLRNTFRRKARLTLTLFTLILAGAIFISVFTVRVSLMLTLDDFASYWNYDVMARFTRPHRITQLTSEALRLPSVVAAESWDFATANRIGNDDQKGPNFNMLAVPADSDMLQPSLVEGRWLSNEDQNAIVLDTDILKEEPDIKVGDEITLKIAGRESEWKVVGVVKPRLTGEAVRFGTAYVNYPYHAEVNRLVGRATRVQVVLSESNAQKQLQAATLLEEHFNSIGLNVRSIRTSDSIRDSIVYQFNILIVFLSVMVVMLAAVGALGLMGTMSINVLERAREIGVMRAIGASDGAVLQIFIVEGMLIGAMSWPFSVLLALPISQILSDTLGTEFTGSPLIYKFSLEGTFICLIGLIALSFVASFLPAWNAARMTVREVLAYE